MILDKYLTFLTGTDTPVTTSKVLPLGQKDLTGDTSGMGPYSNFFLQVSAANTIASMAVTMEHGDTETGPFTVLLASPTMTGLKAGDVIVKVPVPFGVKNWVRLKFSVAAPVNAFLTYGVDKGVVIND